MKLSIAPLNGEAYEVEADASATVRELQHQQDRHESIRKRRSKRQWLLGTDILDPSSTLKDLTVEVGLADGAVIIEIFVNEVLVVTASSDHTAKLWSLNGSCTRTFTGHGDQVISVTLNDDCSMLLTASHDRSAKIWDIESGACIQTLAGHCDYLASAAFSKDSEMALTASRDRTVMVWSVQSGTCLQTFTARSLRECNNEYVVSAVFSPHEAEALVLTASREDNIVKLWRARSGRCIQSFAGHGYFVRSGAVSPDCSMVLTASQDRTAKLWIIDSGLCIRSFAEHRSTVWSAAFSMDGRFVLTSSLDHTAKLWSIETGACTQTFTGHEDGLTSAVFCPDGVSVLTTSRDHTARLWTIESGECDQTFTGHTDKVTTAGCSPGGDGDSSASGYCLPAVAAVRVLFASEESTATAGSSIAEWLQSPQQGSVKSPSRFLPSCCSRLRTAS